MEARGQNGGAMEKNPTCKQSSRSNLALQLEFHLANFFQFYQILCQLFGVLLYRKEKKWLQ